MTRAALEALVDRLREDLKSGWLEFDPLERPGGPRLPSALRLRDDLLVRGDRGRREILRTVVDGHRVRLDTLTWLDGALALTRQQLPDGEPEVAARGLDAVEQFGAACHPVHFAYERLDFELLL